MTIEILTVIIAACHLGASGMGGEYSRESVVVNHQKIMAQSNLSLQRECQKKLIACVNKRDKGADVEYRLSKCLETE